MSEVTKPWAVILGVSSGTGAAVAKQIARDPGYHIFGVHRGRYPESAQEVQTEIERAGRQAVFRKADAGTAEGAKTGVEDLLRHAPKHSVKLLAHAVASASVGRFLDPNQKDLAPRQFEHTFDVMAHSFVYWAQELFRKDLLAPEARILGFTNMLPDSTLMNAGLISASKAALEMYVRHLAMELGPYGHRVNLLKFATVFTPALQHVLSEEVIARLERVHAKMIPAGRMLQLDEVARFVSVLCRDEAEWFNGATIDFTGGMTQHLLDVVFNHVQDTP